MSEPKYLMVCCQRGAEIALKQELQQLHPTWRASFSRPGFVTFKVPEVCDQANPVARSVFARAWSWFHAKVTSYVAVPGSPTIDELELATSKIVDALPVDVSWSQLHVWSRDAAKVGQQGYEPGPTAENIALQQLMQQRLGDRLANETASLRVGQRILDVIQVEPDEYWIGEHIVVDGEPWSRWVGGCFRCEVGEEIVSRAYIKMREALTTFRFPAKGGDTVIEIGSSPGGASQALLEKKLRVIGVDPAEMHESLMKQKHFTYWRMRGNEIRKSHLRGVKWLTADLNVAPAYTLSTVGDIVTNQNVRIAGMLLTIKLPEWSLAEQIREHLKEVKSWGYKFIRARQMSHNRQEYCLCALRKKEDSQS